MFQLRSKAERLLGDLEKITQQESKALGRNDLSFIQHVSVAKQKILKSLIAVVQELEGSGIDYGEAFIYRFDALLQKLGANIAQLNTLSEVEKKNYKDRQKVLLRNQRLSKSYR